MEANVNHFYNCKFVIKSREGSKSTNKGRESQSRSKERNSPPLVDSKEKQKQEVPLLKNFAP